MENPCKLDCICQIQRVTRGAKYSTPQVSALRIPVVECARNGARYNGIHDQGAVCGAQDFDQIECAADMFNRLYASFYKAACNQKAGCVVSSIWISEPNDQHVCVRYRAMKVYTGGCG